MASNDTTADMPANRDYDWNDYVPSGVEEYIPHDGEWDRINAEIDFRDESGRLQRFRIEGPTGCAKTTLARYIAQERGFPLFTIQGKYSMNEADLLGSPVLVEGETRWADGTLTKALMCSAERPTVLLIDEANRARPEAKSVLFSALDDRAEVTLDAKGGEVVQGDALNLIVIATVNKGPGYFTEKMDKAERRRLGPVHRVDYLGIEHPEREENLLTDRTPASDELAQLLVTTANDVRERAEDAESDVRSGVPTATVMDWSRAAYAYDKADVVNPVVAAAENAVLNAFFDQDENEADEVRTIIKSRLDGAPFDSAELSEWIHGQTEYAACAQCDFGMDAVNYSNDHGQHAQYEECPDCGGNVQIDTRDQLTSSSAIDPNQLP